jgi:hypothetical protein
MGAVTVILPSEYQEETAQINLVSGVCYTDNLERNAVFWATRSNIFLRLCRSLRSNYAWVGTLLAIEPPSLTILRSKGPQAI